VSTEEVEVRAKELGWVPVEEFKGDPERWVDAETFVRRGEEMMPLLRAENKKLRTRIESTEGELVQVKNLLKASAESIEELKRFNSTVAKERAKDTKRQLVTAIAEARREGDVETEVELQDQLRETTTAIAEADKKPVVASPAAPATTELSSTFKEWMTENTWFGENKRKTALAMGVAEELKANPATANLPEKQFLAKVTEEVNAMFETAAPRKSAKVEEGARGNGGDATGATSRGRAFSDLPPEAKAACEAQAKRLVGAGRAFKDVTEWRKHYVTKYYEGEG